VTTNRLHDLYTRISAHSDEVGEHEAAVDLLVLTAYSDHRVNQAELDALDRFDVDHTDWDAGAFNVSEYLPSAIAKVRTALDQDGGADRLLATSAARLSTAAVKEETVKACQDLASTAGSEAAESDFAERVRQALA
jgi:hypothetical protein